MVNNFLKQKSKNRKEIYIFYEKSDIATGNIKLPIMHAKD
jgi:hypothetical protein